MKTLKVPEATVIRLSVYSRYLNQLQKNGIKSVSSGEIAEGINGSSAQVRKDLAYFGDFGTRGVGYDVSDLNRHIIKILGLEKEWKTVIIGAGNLGAALTQYKGFQERGFNTVAVFDNDINKVGLKLGGIPIYPITQAEQFVIKEEVKIGIVAVPARYAQEVVDILVKAGVAAILNFASKAITVPKHIEVRNVDLSVNLEILTFNMSLK